MSARAFEQFWTNVSKASSNGSDGSNGFLAGVVYGPHVRVPLTEFVARATAAGAGGVRQYADITHTLSDQFPLSGLHPAWSLTHGRQVRNMSVEKDVR
jgi:hypothetical protein